MKRLVLAATKYKQHFYQAGVDKPKGFQLSLTLMALFLLSAVFLGFTGIDNAMISFVVLSLFFAVFPFIFPKSSDES